MGYGDVGLCPRKLYICTVYRSVMRCQYKIEKLVSNVPQLANHEDLNLCGSSGLAMDAQHTLWSANGGNNTIDRNVTHYDLEGHTLSPKLPFIDYESPTPLVPASQQRQLISDLLWLQKNVLFYQQEIIFNLPKIYGIAPILGVPGDQPSPEELSLDAFLNAPNGYLGSLVNVTFLINFCINNPLPLRTPNGRKATQILSDAHNLIYKQLILDLTNRDLIRQYGEALMEAQSWLQLGTLTAKTVPFDDSDQMRSVETVAVVGNDQLPIGLVYNTTKGFVGYQLNEHRASSDLIAGTPKGVIYTYSSLINTGQYYGMITVLDNSANYSIYTGIAMANNRIYLTDLANRRIDVYDFGWIALREITQAFTDPDLPSNYAPYNIVSSGSELYVMYARIDETSQPVGNKLLYGSGLGIINVFNWDGVFLRRAATYGRLNAPWGVTVVDEKFSGEPGCSSVGKFLVSNHGDGRVLVFNQKWEYLGRLMFANHYNAIDGLYGLRFHRDRVYFSSAPNGGISGLLGRIRPSRRPCPPCRPCPPPCQSDPPCSSRSSGSSKSPGSSKSSCSSRSPVTSSSDD